MHIINHTVIAVFLSKEAEILERVYTLAVAEMVITAYNIAFLS